MRYGVPSVLDRVGPYVTVLLATSVTLLIWLGAFHYLDVEKIQTEQAARRIGSNLARAFEEQIIRSVRAIDQTLLVVRNAYANNPDTFDLKHWANANFNLNEFAFQVSMIDPNGRLMGTNLASDDAKVDLSDREHFKVHTQSKTDELFISKPVLGRVSGKMAIQLTRRILMPDGSFGGVVVVSLDPDYLTKFYELIDIGDNASVALVGTDRIVRARASRNADKTVGAKVPLTAFERAKEGNFTAVSILDRDRVERAFTYREIRGLPLIVVVGLSTEEIFRAFKQHRTNTIMLSSALTIWLLLLSALVLWYQAALSKSRKAAEEGTRARSSFLATMSYELRTPMNAVIGLSELLLKTPLGREQHRYVETINQSGGHLLTVINDILDFSRLEANRDTIDVETFRPADLVDGVIRMARNLPGAATLRIEAKIAPNVPVSVVGDAAHTSRILINFMSNAVKFTDAGSITLHVTTASRVAEDVRLRFVVEDTGCGISTEDMRCLFQPFTQASSSGRRGGTGLGLAICKRFAELMNGGIGIESEVGRGTKIWCEIPFGISAADQPEAARQPARNAATARRLKVLVAEDVEANQLVIRAMLEKAGHRVEVVADGVAAIDYLKDKPVDLVLMDVQMPVMDGYEATRIIRRLPGKAGKTPIVALTAFAQQSDRDEALATGMNSFLRKPLRSDDLAAMLVKMFPEEQTMDTDDDGLVDRDALQALRDAVGAEKLAVLYKSFLADAHIFVAALREAARTHNSAEVHRTAHRLCGLFGQFGSPRVADLAADVENAEDPLSMAEQLITTCEAALAKMGPLAL